MSRPVAQTNYGDFASTVGHELLKCKAMATAAISLLEDKQYPGAIDTQYVLFTLEKQLDELSDRIDGSSQAYVMKEG